MPLLVIARTRRASRPATPVMVAGKKTWVAQHGRHACPRGFTRWKKATQSVIVTEKGENQVEQGWNRVAPASHDKLSNTAAAVVAAATPWQLQAGSPPAVNLSPGQVAVDLEAAELELDLHLRLRRRDAHRHPLQGAEDHLTPVPVDDGDPDGAAEDVQLLERYFRRHLRSTAATAALAPSSPPSYRGRRLDTAAATPRGMTAARTSGLEGGRGCDSGHSRGGGVGAAGDPR